ncbi:FecR family protein [Sphingobacterium thalpophilum]|uniref:FecR family protein n=1 Tax=Sphingobacterium thalpophilum TaxID=259 RepID=UPI0024A77C28|nr:FecR family protein [Sphingobacterium thalpophilum]
MMDQNSYESEKQARRTAFLLAAYLRKEASEVEIQELLTWRKESERNEELFEALSDSKNIKKNLSEYAGYGSALSYKRLAQRITAETCYENRNSESLLKQNIIVVAAIFIALLGIIFFVYQQTSIEVDRTRSDQVRLVLSGRATIMLDSVNGTLNVLKNNIVDQQGRELFSNTGEASDLVYLEVPAGRQQEIILSDGSCVWLNSLSSLKFPLDFAENGRKVELKGEGYFKIKHENDRSFEVNSRSQRIVVLGTEFNLRAFPGEEIRTTLVRGRVSIENNKKKKSLFLHPGEQSIMTEDGTTYKRPVDVDAEIAWKYGAISFNGKTFAQSMDEIARAYGFELQYHGPIPNHNLSGSIHTGANPAVIEVLLRSIGVDFTINGKQLIINNRKEVDISK